jgi:glycosyltransferase involved in cell wall biosynthesis
VNHPRALFLTPAAFNRTTGGGITFGNLFTGWPRERLATVHSDPVPVTTETCERYYRLGPAEVRRWGPLEWIAPAAGRAPLAGAPGSGSRGGGRLRAMKQAMFGAQLPDTGTLSPALERWIADFRPEVLYTILGSNAMIDLADAIQRRFGIPLVIHMMDDWPETSYEGGALGFLARARMQRRLADLMRRAAVRMGICDAMSEAYAARYGVPFVSFQNAIDGSRWSSSPSRPSAARRPAHIVYAGSILPFAQHDSLADCCAAVAQLASEGELVRLSVYSPALYAAPFRERLVLSPAIELQDALTDDAAFFRTISEADALLLPVNFDAATVRYIRYSMPTKVPAYLFSGTPILAYGPAGTAQIRYARESEWALVVAERGVSLAAAGLRRILADEPLRARLSESARRTAFARHDATRVRAQFQAQLACAAGEAGAPTR